ncbi:hypothetical protein C8R46DRAFT_1053470 [Mycena filopes]|nr:hypothetical protein C8R46DRAFT_1053470 [Mycena filopes]
MSTEQNPPSPQYPHMTDSMSYSSGSYISQSSYYPSPQLHHGPHSHEVSHSPARSPQRANTGCLTCRVKKIKCDEAKPSCMRCAHGQRDCTWPEGVPARKRAPSVKESPDGSGRPSTASSTASPGLSESSSPSSTRGHSPPQRSPVELSLPPLLSSNRRQDSNYLPRMSHPSDLDPPRREYSRERGRYSPPESSNLSLVPEISSYPAPSRYEHPYTSNGHHTQHAQSSRHTLAASSVRSTMGGHPSSMQQQQWSPPSIMSPEPYYHAERPLVGEQIPRYH